MYTASYIAAVLPDWKNQDVSKAEIVQWLAEMCLGWQYVYASQGQACTPSWRRSRISYCPEEKYVTMIRENCPVLSGKQPNCDGCDFVDTDVFDCAGFVLWLLAKAGVPFYGQGATTAWNTPSNWAARGEIKDMPKNLVCVVYKRRGNKMSHTGMSMGDGAGGVIHCSTFVKRGNAYTDNSPWTHWGIPKGLYSTEELRKAGIDVADNTPTLRRGSQGDEVADLQMLLNSKFGYNLDVDGNFGKATEAAVKDFQKKHGLTSDGVVGKKTWAALGVMPTEKPETPQPIDRYRYAWDTLLAAIKNPYGVAGLMGNLQAESGINPENLQNTGERALGMTDQQYTEAVDKGTYTAEQFATDGYGYGIAQWTYKSRKAALLKYAHEHEFSVGDLGMQVDFLLDELRFSYPRVMYTLQNATTVREASDSVLLDFERPKNQSEENQARRAELGQKILDEYAQPEQPATDDQPPTICIPYADFQAIRAAVLSAYHILRKYEGV